MYLICIHFGIERFMLFWWCKQSGLLLFTATTTTTKNDSFNYYSQIQPHGDRLKAEMNFQATHPTSFREEGLKVKLSK